MSGRRRAVVLVDGIAHPVTGAQVALVRDGRVLLQLRPWPPGWELPGGHCEPDEDPRAAAEREVEEETGIHARVLALAGVYRWAGLRRSADALFVAEPVGGSPRRSIEAVRTRYVTADTLPRTVFPWIPVRVRDALAAAAGAPPVVRNQPVSLRHVLFFGATWAGAAVDAVRRLRRRRWR